MVIPLFGIDSTVCPECPYLNVRGTVFSKTISVVATPQKREQQQQQQQRVSAYPFVLLSGVHDSLCRKLFVFSVRSRAILCVHVRSCAFDMHPDRALSEIIRQSRAIPCV